MPLYSAARRCFLYRTGVMAIAAWAGSRLGVASETSGAWPKAAFQAKGVDQALAALDPAAAAQSSDAITLTAPEIAENGAVVPITISTTLPEVESIDILVEKNETPLIARFEVLPGTLPQISTHIKMNETSKLIAVVKSQGRLYQTAKNVKVTIGGCGG